ncbi:MAG: TatD family hydrolase [Desulfuromonadales bacterium]|nr:TatD family hydrolase [Desulfuromonadales bacterium]
MTRYIDTHIHLDLLTEPALLLQEADQVGVGAWVVPGIAPEQWSKVMATTALHEQVYLAPGIHPQAAGNFQKAHLDKLRQLLTYERAVAIGEVGLDRQLDIPCQQQEELFIAMIRLAREMEKPLLIHTRRSTERILELLQREGGDQVGGIFHAFSGSLETARRILGMGFLLGVGGVVTLQTARRLPEVIRKVPAEALVLETDAPYLAPEQHRGQPNRPAYLELIARQVARLRDWSLAETAQQTTLNACRVLGLPLPDTRQKDKETLENESE